MFSMHSSNAAPVRERRLERIEIDDEQVDRRDVVGEHRRLVLGIVADRQQPAMDLRVQGLDPPVHHLGKAGEIGHVADRKPRLGERLARAAGGDELDAERGQGAGEIDEAGLVGNGNQRPPGAAERSVGIAATIGLHDRNRLLA